MSISPHEDSFLCRLEAAKFCGINPATLFKQVNEGRLPAPVYPAPRAPRWRRSELIAALEATRALPREARAARRAARIASSATA
jgi:predicted DNA-binding transcriptional regulator AlpA